MEWIKYIEYLKEWAVEHKDNSFKGMSPVSYDEWRDNEGGREKKNKRFIIKITEIYTRVVDIKAKSKKEAESLIEEKINTGAIDLPCDGEKYDYTNSIEIIGEVE